jgi:hypothetical protein
MKKATIFFCIAMISMSFATSLSDCDTLVFFKEGVKTTMTSYNADGKAIGTTKTIYKKVDKNGGTMSVNATQENYDKKGKLSVSSDFTIKCLNGTLLFDMKLMLPQQQAESFKDFEMMVEGADKEIPVMNMSVKIANRKVESKESITTAAGTFECYKITEDVEMKTIFKIHAKVASWFSKEVGTVKTESYKENGKLTGKTELTEITK